MSIYSLAHILNMSRAWQPYIIDLLCCKNNDAYPVFVFHYRKRKTTTTPATAFIVEQNNMLYLLASLCRRLMKSERERETLNKQK